MGLFLANTNMTLWCVYFSPAFRSTHWNSYRGCAAVSPRKELVVIDNTINGFMLYPLDSATPIWTFVTDPPLVWLPNQVAFGEDSRLVVGGSDNGSIYQFERTSGQLLTKLLHGEDSLVQTITVCECTWSMCFIHSSWLTWNIGAWCRWLLYHHKCISHSRSKESPCLGVELPLHGSKVNGKNWSAFNWMAFDCKNFACVLICCQVPSVMESGITWSRAGMSNH